MHGQMTSTTLFTEGNYRWNYSPFPPILFKHTQRLPLVCLDFYFPFRFVVWGCFEGFFGVVFFAFFF